EHAVADLATLAAERVRLLRGGVLLHPPRREHQRHPVRETLRKFRLRSRSARRSRGGGTLQGVRTAPRRLEVRCPLRAILLRPETAMSASRRLAVGGCALLACG